MENNIKKWFGIDNIEKIKTCNLKNKNVLTEPWEIRVDRTSILGNPFKLETESERNIVCEKYDSWLTNEIKNDNMEILKEISRLLHIYIEHGKLHLYCWCKPQRCHSESIINILYRWLEFRRIFEK